MKLLSITSLRQRVWQTSLATSLLGFTHSAFADLPTPASYEYAQDGDWLKTGQAIGNKSVNIFLIFLGVALIIVVFSGILRGYQTAQERQEMSHFFKAVGVGLICLALGIGLLYGAHLIIGGH